MKRSYGSVVCSSSSGDGYCLIDCDRLGNDGTCRVVADGVFDVRRIRVVMEEGAGLDETEEGEHE